MSAMGEALATRAQELTGRREPFVRATVVRAQHPTSAQAGDTGLLLSDGTLEGFVCGACVQSSVREYGLKSLATREPILLRVVAGEPSHRQEEGAVQVSNPCLSGGAVEIFLEPSVPSPRVLVVGSTPIAHALVALGGPLGLHLQLVAGLAASVDIEPRPNDAALIVASHGRDEEPALEAALRAGVPYVGLVASHARGAAVLASLNVTDEQRARVLSPAGLQLGARSPAEIALSILAQLVAERAAAHPAETEAANGVPAADTAPAAIDPVCGMSVTVGDTTPSAEFAGATFHVCSESCRRTFLADPERYANAS
ncbi:YHS domain-containing protein [Cryobacterium sp. TMT1-21]|nr:YHS domain-containing protein [Cryobacterium sp. TMT1-21]